MKINIIWGVLCLMLLNIQYTTAQRGRFVGDYPIAQPSSSVEYKEEFQKTLDAMMGGIKILESPNTPKSRSDAEAYIVDDYKASLAQMATHASEASAKTAKDQTKELDKVTKSIKGSKYAAASTQLLALGAKAAKDNEIQFFIWKDYLDDLKNKAPWTNPKNIKVTRIYRMMLDYMSKNYERPFGTKAEQGAVAADGAQALSNCLENPNKLDWEGETKMSMREGDQLRRLASVVAYYDWRRHDVNSGKRAAHIDTKVVRLLHLSLYDIVRSIIQRKGNWDADPAHGKNLLGLFEATLSNGWNVNGDRAQKQ